MKTFACFAALSALSAFGAARPDATITFDVSAPAFKDQRDSRANPVMGWAGTITDGHYWSGPIYYDRTHIPMTTWLAMGADPAKRPRNTGNVDWVLTANPGRTSAALLVCNTKDVEWKPTFRVVGGTAGRPRVWLFRCREKDIWLHQTPGEPPPSWQEEFDGDPAAIVIPAYTMATLVFPVEKAAK